MNVAFFPYHVDAPLVIGYDYGLMVYPVPGLFADCQHIRYDGLIADTGFPFYTALKINMGPLYGLSEESVVSSIFLDWASRGSGFVPPGADTEQVSFFADHADLPIVIGSFLGLLQYPVEGLFADAQHVNYSGAASDAGSFFYTALKVNFGQVYSLAEETVSFDFLIDWSGQASTVWMGAYKNLESAPFNGGGKGVYLSLASNPQPVRVDAAGQIRSLQLRFLGISSVSKWEISRIEGRLVRQPRAGG